MHGSSTVLTQNLLFLYLSQPDKYHTFFTTCKHDGSLTSFVYSTSLARLDSEMPKLGPVFSILVVGPYQACKTVNVCSSKRQLIFRRSDKEAKRL